MNITLRLTNYISRYAPSRSRVTAYLTRKNCLDPDTLLHDLGYDESLMMSIWMRTYIAMGKGRSDIIRRLMVKGFSRELIMWAVEEGNDDIQDWELQSPHIMRQIETLRSRRKSTQVIQMTLVSRYPYFRDEIRALLADRDDVSALDAEYDRYASRYDLSDPRAVQKLYAALMRKGFSYDEIKMRVVDRDSE